MAESLSVPISDQTCCLVPVTEPPLAGPHEWWCGRTGVSHPLLPDFVMKTSPILFPDSTAPSASHLGTFSFGNRKGTCTRYCFPVIASNISLTFVGTLYLTIGWDVLQGGKFGNWNAECGIKPRTEYQKAQQLKNFAKIQAASGGEREGVQRATADFVCFHCPLLASAETKPLQHKKTSF
mgnify:CR=1 FL=1